jgi:hypothetical protein
MSSPETVRCADHRATEAGFKRKRNVSCSQVSRTLHHSCSRARGPHLVTHPPPRATIHLHAGAEQYHSSSATACVRQYGTGQDQPVHGCPDTAWENFRWHTDTVHATALSGVPNAPVVPERRRLRAAKLNCAHLTTEAIQ